MRASAMKEPVKYFDSSSTLNLESPHPYKVMQDEKNSAGDVVGLTTETYQRVLGKFAKGIVDSSDRGVVLTLYPTKRKNEWFQRRYKIYALAVSKSSLNKQPFGYRDGKSGDSFTSSIFLTPNLYARIQYDLDLFEHDPEHKYAAIRIGIKRKRVSIFSGLRGKSPVENYNIGWKFAYISALISIPFTLLSMLGEAYHVPDKLRFALEWTIMKGAGLVALLVATLQNFQAS